MRAMPVLAVVAALLVASVPFLAPQAEAREGQLAAPSLRDRAEDGSRMIEWRGSSSIEMTGFCLPALRTCFGSNDTEDGRYFLPAVASDGRVVVEWRAVNDSLRQLEVSVGGATKNGTSPLVFDFLGAPAGEYAVHAEPMQLVAGTWTQSLQWQASFRVDAPSATLELLGHASYATATGCALLLCDPSLGLVESKSDPLVTPWTTMGTVVFTWDPTSGPMRISIPGTEFLAEGDSPLTLNLDGLTAGEWQFDVRPPTLTRPLSTFDAQWSATLMRHP